jgi:hypothetical protein
MPVPRAAAATVRAVATGRAATFIYKAIFDSELYKVCGSYMRRARGQLHDRSGIEHQHSWITIHNDGRS